MWIKDRLRRVRHFKLVARRTGRLSIRVTLTTEHSAVKSIGARQFQAPNRKDGASSSRGLLGRFSLFDLS